MFRFKSVINRFLRQENMEQVMPGVPVTELAGDRRLLIENHFGVLEYGCERIGVRVAFGGVYILGKELSLLIMNSNRIVIDGQIESILLKRSESFHA